MNHYFNFSPTLKQLLEKGTSVDASGQELAIHSASTVNNLHVIRELLLAEKANRTLEVGLAFGLSALTFLETHKEIHGSAFQHSAIDPFQKTHWKGTALRVIREQGYDQEFRHIERLSSHALSDLAQEPERFGLIYIDGSHIFEDVFVDFYFSAIILEKGGVMLFDDCTDKHVAKVIRFIRRNYAGILEEIDLLHYSDPEKGPLKRLANRLGYRQICGFRKIAEPPRSQNVSMGSF